MSCAQLRVPGIRGARSRTGRRNTASGGRRGAPIEFRSSRGHDRTSRGRAWKPAPMPTILLTATLLIYSACIRPIHDSDGLPRVLRSTPLLLPRPRLLPRRRHLLCTPRPPPLPPRRRPRHPHHHRTPLRPSLRQKGRLKASQNMEPRPRETALLPPRTVRLPHPPPLPVINPPSTDPQWGPLTDAPYTSPPSRPTSTGFIINCWPWACIPSRLSALNPIVDSTQRPQRYPLSLSALPRAHRAS